jgi:hypothetical protein
MASEMREDTDNVAFVGEFDLLLFHCTKHNLEGVQEILENGDLPLFALIFGEALGVYQSHLLQDGRFPRFSRTCANVSIVVDAMRSVRVGVVGGCGAYLARGA